MLTNISLLDSIELALLTEMSGENLKNLTFKKHVSEKLTKKKLLNSWRTTLDIVNDVTDGVHLDNGEKRYLTTKLKTALEQLIKKVDTTKIARSKKNTSGIVFGRVSISKIISEYWSPVFNEAVPESSYSYWFLQRYGTSMSLSFADHVQNFDGLNEYADLILRARDAIKINAGDNYSELMYQGECLDVTASIIKGVVRAFDQCCWCNICFRRSAAGRKYCREHKRTEDIGPGVTEKGKSTQKGLTDQTLGLLCLYRLRRNLLKESFHCSLGPESIPSEITINWRSINLSPPINIFIENFEDDCYWENSKSQWDALFELMPFLREKLNNNPSSYSSWKLFLSAFLKSIQDLDEKTMHPLWVLHIVVIAERWFEVDSKNVDRRRTNTAVSIKELLNKGMKQTEIAKQLGITPAAVSKSIKQMKQI